MDFEKKYNDALFRASKFRVQDPFDPVGQMVEHIFPELADSEDERTKKEIIYILKGGKCYPSNNDIFKYIAYLEKQGKKLDADKVIAWLRKNWAYWCEQSRRSLQVDVVKQFKEDFGL